MVKVPSEFNAPVSLYTQFICKATAQLPERFLSLYQHKRQMEEKLLLDGMRVQKDYLNVKKLLTTSTFIFLPNICFL